MMKKSSYLISVVVTSLILFSLAAVGCDLANAQAFNGIINSIDTADGKITVITYDGKTVEVLIKPGTLLNSSSSGLITMEALEKGMHVDVELDDSRDDVAHTINAAVAKVEGFIQIFQNNKLTITPEYGGMPVVVNVTPNTLIRQVDLPASTSALQVGVKVEVKYDSLFTNAFKIQIESHEHCEIKGTVTAISGDRITIKGSTRTLTINITAQTVFKDGTRQELQLQQEVEAWFDPVSSNALEIDLSPDGSYESDIGEDRYDDSSSYVSQGMYHDIYGTLTSYNNGIITVQTTSGQAQFSFNASTRVEFESGAHGILSDLTAGKKVEIEYLPGTNVAVEVNIRSDTSTSKYADVYGILAAYANGKITVHLANNQVMQFDVNSSTRIEIDGTFNSILSSLPIGRYVEVEYLPPSALAIEINIKQNQDSSSSPDDLYDSGTSSSMWPDFYGNVTQYSNGNITIQAPGGQSMTFDVSPTARVEIKGSGNGTLSDVKVGQTVEIEYVPSTNTVVKINVKQP